MWLLHYGAQYHVILLCTRYVVCDYFTIYLRSVGYLFTSATVIVCTPRQLCNQSDSTIVDSVQWSRQTTRYHNLYSAENTIIRAALRCCVHLAASRLTRSNHKRDTFAGGRVCCGWGCSRQCLVMRFTDSLSPLRTKLQMWFWLFLARAVVSPGSIFASKYITLFSNPRHCLSKEQSKSRL